MDGITQDTREGRAGALSDHRRLPVALVSVALLSVVVLAWLYYPTVAQLRIAWRDDEYYSHGVFLPFVSAWLIWSHRTALAAAWNRRRSRAGFPGLLAGGLCLLLLGMMADVNFVRAMSLPLVLLGMADFLGGPQLARLLRFPLLFLLLAIPFSRILTQLFTVPMQSSAASGAALMLGLCGMPIERDGVNLYTPVYHFVVAVPCSGLKTTITLLTVSILLVHLLPDLSRGARVGLALLSIPIALAVNALRIVIIVLLGHYFGRDVAEGFLHGLSGLFVFALSLGVLFALGNWLARHASSPATEVPGASPGNELPSAPASGLSANGLTLLGRLAVTAVMLGVTGYVGARAVTADASSLAARRVLALPDRVGPWRGTSVKVDASVYEVLVPDAVVQRRYSLRSEKAKPRDTFQVDVIAIYNKDPRAFHTPDICLKSAGWLVVSDQTREVRLGAKTLDLDVVAGQRKQEQTHIAYFFADTGQQVTGWLPAMVQSATARVLKRQSGAVQVQYGYDPRLEQPGSGFTTAFRQLIFAVAESVRPQTKGLSAAAPGNG